MDATIRPPSILHLTGVTLKDYIPIEDVADEKVREAAGLADEPGPADSREARRAPNGDRLAAAVSPIPFDKIPKVFTTLEEWPLHTNLRCHECSFMFDDRPKFIATYIRANDDGTYEIGVKGNFCTFNDAALHITRTYHNMEERWRALDMLKFVYNLFTGKTVAHIEPAPSKYSLVFYGGEDDEDAFWKKMRDLDPEHGLKNHTPGSVLTERAKMGLMAKRAAPAVAPVGESVFDICRRAAGLPPAESLESQSVPLVTPVAGARPPPAAASCRQDNVAVEPLSPSFGDGACEGDLDSIISSIIAGDG